MHLPTAVGLVEPFTDPDSTLQDLFGRQRPSPQTIRQGLAFQILHDQVADAVLHTDIRKMTNVWMAQAGDRPRLSLETLFGLCIIREAGGKDLDRNCAVQPGVAGAVHLAHSTRT